MDAGRSDPPETFEAVLARVFDAIDEGGADAIDELVAGHPEYAQRLRARLATINALGLDGSTPAETQVLERLGDFRLIRRIGGGGMGVVYMAEQLSLDRRVALKVIRPDHLVFPGSRERFRREVNAIAALQHPGIVPVYTVGEEDGIPFFVMEHIVGCSLEDVLQHLRDASTRALDGQALLDAVQHLSPSAARPGIDQEFFSGTWIDVVCRCALQMAEALHHAHLRGVLHRDVKPSNVMITLDGRVMLVDFGLASSESDASSTRVRSHAGSLAYMAPEQLEPPPDGPDRRLDVYALGATLYELLTFQVPHLGSNTDETRRRILTGDPPPPSRLNPAIPWDVETVCLVALERDRRRRYATAAELAEDLRRFFDRRPITGRRPGAALRAVRWVQRHRTLTTVLACGLALLVGAVWFAQVQRATRLEKDALLADFARLSDSQAVRELFAEEETFWPLAAKNVERMRTWLARARGVIARREEHAAARRELRRRALPWSEADRATDARTRRRTEDQLAHMARDSAHASESWRSLMMESRDAWAALKLKISGSERLTWTFADQRDRWWHRSFSALMEELHRLERLVPSVARRLEDARTIARTLKGAWAEALQAISDVRRHPQYRGLRMQRQDGLVPLGPDPATGLHEFAVFDSGRTPTRDPGTGRLELAPETALVLVLVPGASPLLGCQAPGVPGAPAPNADPHVRPNEGPPYRVRLDPFFISKYEMTQAQWVRVMRDNPSQIPLGARPPGYAPVTPTHPVENMTWYDADRAARRLGLLLPTEAQWEYASRAGTPTPWWTGDDRASVRGKTNLADASLTKLALKGQYDAEPELDDGYPHHSPAGTFAANGFGLYDVIGNVREWCRCAMIYYHLVPANPGDGYRGLPMATQCIIRGGAYTHNAVTARSSWRLAQDPTRSSSFVGMRPSRVIQGPYEIPD